jgi:ribonucleoside-triphosphate reductase (thioredoxin)
MTGYSSNPRNFSAENPAIPLKHRFYLPKDFVESYRTVDPGFGFNGLGEIIYKRTYSRVMENGENEEWVDTVARVVNGCYSIQKDHIITSGLKWNEEQGLKSAKQMFKYIHSMKFLPPGRGLWAGGSNVVLNNGIFAALNNCAFISVKDIKNSYSECFRFMMDMLMLGCGVGFDLPEKCDQITIRQPLLCNKPKFSSIAGCEFYLKNKLTNKQKEDETYDNDYFNGLLQYELDFIQKNNYKVEVFTIPDTREGWVDALGQLIDSYIVPDSTYVTFNYEEIRPMGLPLKTFGGISSGPNPLIQLLIEVRRMLEDNIDELLSKTLICNVMNVTGKAVIAGNVRRSSQIALSEKDDEFINLKNYEMNPDRVAWGWASNNSIFYKVGSDYSDIIERINNNGEPGIFWIDNAREYSRMNGIKDNKDRKLQGINPCGEIPLESGELCCLVEIFPSRITDMKEFLRVIKFAYLYGKTVTLGKSHWGITNCVQQRNRRIGVSVSGVVNFIESRGLPLLKKWLTTGYDKIQYWDEVYSNWFCCPRSIKTTTIKPSGTVSILAGVCSGCHWPQFNIYIRRFRISSTHELVKRLANAGYHIEPDINNKESTVIVQFPVKEMEIKRANSDVSVWEKYQLAETLQRDWADNSVSVTLTYSKEREADQILPLLNYAQYHLKSVSILPYSDKAGVDKDGLPYAQMPYEGITEEQYNEMISNLKPLDLSGLSNKIEVEYDNYCSGDTCEIRISSDRVKKPKA